MNIKKINVFIFYFLSLLYLESLFRIFLYDSFFRLSLINLVFFVTFFAFFLYIWTKAFSRKVNKVLFFIVLFILCLWFAAQFVVKDFLDFYISFNILKIADQVGDFLGKALMEIGKRIPYIIIMFVPFIIAILLRKKIDFNQNNKTKALLSIVLMELSFLFYLGTLQIGKESSYSPYELYARVNNPSINIEKVGVVNTFCLDLYRLIFGFKETIYEEDFFKLENNNYNYNNLDIDFEKLLSNSNDKIVQKITNYFMNDEGTNKNEYTGFFEGKNLILFMAESFNEIAVRKDTMPTLYNLSNSGFIFNNYYSPTIYSTIGGEFQELTGLYADFYNLSKFRSGDNSFPLGIANLFKEKGYNTYAFHNNDYNFQNRNTYLETLGFTNFKGCGNGLEEKIDCNLWPQSDVEMIDATTADYLNSDKPFMVFYASVSGHASYNFTDNDMAKKNKEELDSLGLPYSEPVRAYLAAQMELDKALKLLIDKLEQAGKLDDTVIVLTGDHYPYELTPEQVNEAASYHKDDVIEINHSKFIIWNSKMDIIKVNKVGSQIDVLPTIYNLFNIPYDSRLIAGNDILSDKMGLAIFENRSWVSDKGSYFTTSDTFIPKEDVSDDYVKNMNKIVNNRIVISKYIMEKDYYNLVYNYIKK